MQGDDGVRRMKEWSDTRKRIFDPSVPPPEFSSAAAAAAGADVGASMDMRMERRVAVCTVPRCAHVLRFGLALYVSPEVWASFAISLNGCRVGS